MNPVHEDHAEDHADEDVHGRGRGHVADVPIESSQLIRRLGDGLLAVLVSLVAWAGYYVQTLASDIRVLGVNVVVLQERVEKLRELDKGVHDRIYESVLYAQRVENLEHRFVAIDRVLDEHMKAAAHEGAVKDIALMRQRIFMLEQRANIKTQER